MIQPAEFSRSLIRTGNHPVPILDVRSPKEFVQGHIPGSLNLPLLDNDERHIVGITYKEEGQQAAVRKGFELTGHEFSQYIDTANDLFPDKQIVIYCWRGGLRSNVMSWILHLAGFKITLLKGGYKTYRRWALQKLNEKKDVVILSGETGSGKSEMLNNLLGRGEQVIDLEKIAHHKGSTFGALGQLPQPTQEQFENNLALEWDIVDPGKTLWLEDESRWIGKIKVPDLIYNQMLDTRLTIRVSRSLEERKKRILKEYGHFPAEDLIERTAQLNRRLGGQLTSEAVAALSEGNMNLWVEHMLGYYDRTYTHSAGRKKLKEIKKLDVSALDSNEICDKLISLAAI